MNIVSRKTGTRFTYRIAKGKKEGKVDPSAPWFVSVLTGSNNESDYTFLGSIFATRRVQVGGGNFGPVYGNIPETAPPFVHGKSSTIPKTAPSAVAFAWAWARITRGEMPATCEVWHEGRCGKCGRKLTTPESIANGIGPVCEESAT